MMMEQKGRARSMVEPRAFGAMVLLAVAAMGWSVPCALADEEVHRLSYDGTQSELVASGADLFSQVDTGMPGDTFAGSLTVANESAELCELFVATRDVVANGPDDALERIAYTIVGAEDEVIFDGALGAASATEPISAGTVEPGSSARLDYAVIIPPDLTNEYADMEVGLNVAVSVVERSEGDEEALVGQGTVLGKTGDGLPWAVVVFACSGAVIVGCCVAVMRRRRLIGR